ncbi:MAG: nucleotidyl transferase AbiEii/AbiGii toxin family protein [Bacteroidia bacterium]
MLHYKTVTAETLGFLKLIQANEQFRDLLLVGGTSLALQYGHRQSIDLDFFGQLTLSGEEISTELKNIGKVQVINTSKSIHVFLLDGVKIDFVNYPYPWLEEPMVEDGLRLASDKDIAAMKISAITGRGSKKDFIDLFFLLKRYPIKTILGFYTQKYSEASIYLAIKSLIYFEDAENQTSPIMMDTVKWSEIKSAILAAHGELMNDYK